MCWGRLTFFEIIILLFDAQANVVNIAFGDYSGGLLGQEADEKVVREGIEAIHAKVYKLIRIILIRVIRVIA